MNKEDFDFIMNDVPSWVQCYLKEGIQGRLSAHDLTGIIYHLAFSSIKRINQDSNLDDNGLKLDGN